MRQTSVEAFERLRASGMLETRRGEAYAVTYRNGPITGMELVRDSGVEGLWKRLSELEAMGLVRKVGQKMCSVTGQLATSWDVTDHLFEKSDLEKLKPVYFFLIKKPGHKGVGYSKESQAKKEWKAEDGTLYKVRVVEELLSGHDTELKPQ